MPGRTCSSKKLPSCMCISQMHSREILRIREQNQVGRRALAAEIYQGLMTEEVRRAEALGSMRRQKGKISMTSSCKMHPRMQPPGV